MSVRPVLEKANQAFVIFFVPLGPAGNKHVQNVSDTDINRFGHDFQLVSIYIYEILVENC